jgi:hypothetical protein
MPAHAVYWNRTIDQSAVAVGRSVIVFTAYCHCLVPTNYSVPIAYCSLGFSADKNGALFNPLLSRLPQRGYKK